MLNRCCEEGEGGREEGKREGERKREGGERERESIMALVLWHHTFGGYLFDIDRIQKQFEIVYEGGC